MTLRQKDDDVESCLQVLRRPHEFKIRALEDIRALFPEDWNPFFAGKQRHSHTQCSSAGCVLCALFTAQLCHYAHGLQHDPLHNIADFHSACSSPQRCLKMDAGWEHSRYAAYGCWDICACCRSSSARQWKVGHKHISAHLHSLKTTWTCGPREYARASDLFMVLWCTGRVFSTVGREVFNCS